jgi:hypothetical protein
MAAHHAALPLAELLSPTFTPLSGPPSAAAQRATRAAFSPGGTGLLLLTGLPPPLQALLARLLARAPSLPPRAALLAAHGLGSDTSGPGSPASATLQLAWGAGGLAAAAAAAVEAAGAGAGQEEAAAAGAADCAAPPAPAASPLRREVEALGCAWAAICAAVAAACDAWLPGGPCLAAALEGAREAKARLIYYPPGPAEEPWQAWHKDYGLFTAVSAPQYWSGDCGGGEAPARPALAPLLIPPPGAGLHVLCCKGSSSSDGGGSGGGGGGGSTSGSGSGGAAVVGAAGLEGGCLAIQVGEAAQVLSGGALAAVAHCVLRPSQEQQQQQQQPSRATFVVFCQPPSELPLAPCCAPSTGIEGGDTAAAGAAAAAAAAARVYAAEEAAWAPEHLSGIIPLLAGRWPGAGGLARPCTYTAFGKSTVKAYFGKSGTQKKSLR